MFIRCKRALLATLLFVTTLAPLAINQLASAATYTLLSPRSVKMSSSATSATSVQYTISFTTSSTGYTVGSVVLETCNDPFVGATCTAPDGTFNWNKATIGAPTSQVGITGMTIDSTDSTATKLVLTRTAGAIAGNTAVSFVLGNGSTTGATNPSTLGTFYIRMYTVANTTGSTATLQDAGAVATSTANGVNITSKVQESLTFCAYATASSNTCATVTSNAVNMGDANGILSSTTTDYFKDIYFNLATNSAQAGTSVAVNLFADTLKFGTQSITALGASCTAQSTASGTEQFGIRLSALGTNVTGDNSYNCAANNYKFDVSSAPNLTSVGGQQIAHMTGANAETQTTVTMLAKAASTTEAGIYTNAMSFIAAPTY